MFTVTLLSLVMLCNWHLVQPIPAQTLFPDKATARLVINQNEQRLYVFAGERLFRTLPISTGNPAERVTTTPAWSGPITLYWGTFSSFGTTQDYGYWLFTDYLSDGSWNGDILIHGAPYNFGQNGEKIYKTEQIGKEPRSHGCIQLLPEDAEWFRTWDPIGVMVEIEPIAGGAALAPSRAAP